MHLIQKQLSRMNQKSNTPPFRNPPPATNQQYGQMNQDRSPPNYRQPNSNPRPNRNFNNQQNQYYQQPSQRKPTINEPHAPFNRGNYQGNNYNNQFRQPRERFAQNYQQEQPYQAIQQRQQYHNKNQRPNFPIQHFQNRFQQNQMKSVHQTERQFPKPPGRGRYAPKVQQQQQQPRQYDNAQQSTYRRGRYRGGRDNRDRNRIQQSIQRADTVNRRQFRGRRGRQTFNKKQQRSQQKQYKPKPKRQYRQKQKNSEIDDQEENDSHQMDQDSQKQYSEDSQRDQEQNSEQYDEQAQQSNEQESYSQMEGSKSIEQVIVEKPKITQYNIPVDPKKSDDMCPYEQFKDRNVTFMNNNRDPKHNKLILDTSRSFSIFEIDKSTNTPNYTQTLKRFRRSADRDEEDDDGLSTRDAGRSIKGLQKAIHYVVKYVIDADNMDPRILPFPLPPNQSCFQFMHIYDFLWDRMREMIKDITRLSEQLRLLRPIVEICQQIARFFILAINEGRKKYESKLQFDEKMNRESLTKILTPLMEIYNVSRYKLKSLVYNLKQKDENVTVEMVKKKVQQQGFYISPHQPELTAYALIISNDIKKSLNEKIYDGFEDVGFNPLFSSEQVQLSLQLQKAQANNNFERYFNILEDPNTDYVTSCLILHNLQQIRSKATKVYKKVNQFQKKLPSQFKNKQLKELLRFKKGQQQVFQKFLQFLDVEAGLKQLDLHGIYSCPQFLFEKDKLCRAIYTEKAPSGRVMNTEILSRSQLVTRSWKNSNYDDILIKTFMNVNVDTIEQQIKLTKIHKKSSIQNIPIPKTAPKETEQSAPKISQFMEMRTKINKEKKRQKFLENVGKSIIHIMDICLGKQQAWKKGVNKIFRIIEIKLQRKKRQAMEAFYSYFFMKEKLRFYFVNLLQQTKQAKQHNKSIQQNFTGINCCVPKIKAPMRLTRQFKRKDDIQQLNKTTTFVTKMYENIWRNNPISNQITYYTSSVKILIIISENMYNAKFEVIKNLHNFLSGKTSLQLNSFLNSSIQQSCIHEQRYCFRYFTKQQKIKILQYQLIFQKVQTSSFIPQNFNVHLYDSIIVLQFEDNMIRILKNLNENYLLYYPKQNNSTNVQLIKKIDKKLKKPIKYIHFVNEDRKVKINSQQKIQDLYRNLNITCQYYFINMERLSLNTVLKMEMRKFLLSTIRECNSVPESCCMKLTDLLIEIKLTSKHIRDSFITQDIKQTMAYYEVYINHCFSQIRKYQNLIFTSFQLLRNWDEINKQFFNLINTGTAAKITGYTGYRYFLDELLCKLQMTFVQEIKDHRHEHNKKYLQYMIRDYLNNFDFNSEMKDQMLTAILQNVTLKNGNIQGETLQIMQWILTKLSKYLSYVFVIMPKGYKFYMDKQYFLKEVNRLINKNNNQKEILQHKKKQVQQCGLQKSSIKTLKPWQMILVLQTQTEKDVKKKQQRGKRSVQQLYQQVVQEKKFQYKYAYMLDELRKRRKISV